MNTSVSGHRLFSLLLFFISFSAYCAQPFTFKGSEGATIGVYIENLATGQTTASFNKEKLFIPASTTKCVTAAAAVSLLPEDKGLFGTSAWITGNISDGILDGSIVIKGGGDPTLGTRHLEGCDKFVQQICDRIRQLGIDSISGGIIADGTLYDPTGESPYWLIEDIAWEYGAGIYGLNYSDNSFSLKIDADSPEQFSILDAQGLELFNTVTRSAKATGVTAIRGVGSSELRLSGSTTGPSYSSRYSLPFPGDILCNDIAASLSRTGIECSYSDTSTPETTDVREILEYESPSRDNILRSMMVKSNNLYAEAMLRALALTPDDKRHPLFRGPQITREDALKIEKTFLTDAELDISKVRINDGCGLAVNNRISPVFMASLLRVMAAGDNSDAYLSLFPRVGKEGTVRGLLAKTALSGKLALKSGSMTGVLCYAGYKLDLSGKPTHSVVIMVNGFTCRTAEVRNAIGRYLLSVFK